MKRRQLLQGSAAVASVCLAACRPRRPSDPIPRHDLLSLHSSVLGERRTVTVWHPDLAPDVALPVLYMPDGGVREDFPHVANTVAMLISQGVLPPVRVVGIENTDRQRDLTGPTQVPKDREMLPSNGGSAVFRSCIRDELIGHIESRYACDDKRALMGESLAGLFVVETFFEEPELFDAHIAFSPSLWWNGGALSREASQRLESHPGGALFLASANEIDLVRQVASLAGALELASHPEIRWTYEPRPDLRHWTIFRTLKEAALTWALGPWHA
ncbi:MAG: alpha/beta hydrolase [Nannocystaceae bacterium]|nr:alpha/beta hydrolase [Nannocystaceae bacterium]